jgi:hypothetical protein
MTCARPNATALELEPSPPLWPNPKTSSHPLSTPPSSSGRTSPPHRRRTTSRCDGAGTVPGWAGGRAGERAWWWAHHHPHNGGGADGCAVRPPARRDVQRRTEGLPGLAGKQCKSSLPRSHRLCLDRWGGYGSGWALLLTHVG